MCCRISRSVQEPFFFDALLMVFMNYCPHTSDVSGVTSGGWVTGCRGVVGGIFSLHSGHH